MNPLSLEMLEGRLDRHGVKLLQGKSKDHMESKAKGVNAVIVLFRVES